MHYKRISADCHLDMPCMPPELFVENASRELKAKMPHVIDGPDGLMVEVIDDGSPDRGPEVQGDRYASQGHGLFLVEQLASRWGYLRDAAGTTVWFELDRSAGDGGAA